MIVGEGAYGKRFVIATPTKTGTTTLEYLAHRIQGGKREPSLPHWRVYDDERPRRQHRMALPADIVWGSATRYLLVRNPYARYVSIYEYMRHPTNFSQWGTRSVQGSAWGGTAHNPWASYDPMDFSAFLGWYVARREEAQNARSIKRRGYVIEPRAYRSPWVWTDSLTESWRHLSAQPGDSNGMVKLVRLENLFGREGDLARTLWEHRIDTSFVVKPLHGNRTTIRHRTGEAVPAVKGAEHMIWADYFGGDTGLCSPLDRGLAEADWGCVNVERWGGPCPVCAIGVASEARALGYRFDSTDGAIGMQWDSATGQTGLIVKTAP